MNVWEAIGCVVALPVLAIAAGIGEALASGFRRWAHRHLERVRDKG